MLDPISIGLGAIQGLSGLGGLLGAASAKRRAEAARQKAINDISSVTDTDYGNLVQNDRTNLLAATGLGGDAINSLGRNLGSSLAGAGVYNSSATAGALQQAQGATQANLAGLAGQNFQNEQGLLNQNRRYITGLRSNLANQQYGEASQNLDSSRQGLSSFLGTLGQFNLARSGANQNQAGLGRQAGGYGGLSPLSPGAGTNFNPEAFGTPGIIGNGAGNLGTGGYSPPISSVLTPFSRMATQRLQGLRQSPQFGTGGYNPNGY